MNKSNGGGGGGSTIKNIADLLIDEVNRNLVEKGSAVEYWIQPILTENGTIGGDTFAVSTNVPILDDCPIYHAFDGVKNTLFHSKQGANTGYFDMYSPDPLCITNIQITNQAYGKRASARGIILACNDGINWTQIKTYTNNVQASEGVWNIPLTNNSNYYKYYRLESTQGGSNGYWVIAEINLTATVKRIIQ